MGVHEFAEHLGTTSDTVRYYTRIGYLKPRRNLNNGYKEYDEDCLLRLVFILRARQLGLSVEDIGKVLAEVEKGAVPCPLVRKLLDSRLQEVERKLAETAALRDRMKGAVSAWKNKPDKHLNDNRICGLIDELEL